MVIIDEKKKKRVGRKSKYDQWISADNLLVLKGWARDGLTDIEIAENIGIRKTLFYEWCNQHTEFAEALKEGRRPVLVSVEDAFFEKKLNGYFVDEEVVEITEHPDGSKTRHKRVYKRWIPPDTTAMIFFLKCRKGNIYNDRLQVQVDTDIVDGKLERLIEAVKDVK